jgi:hypothetical protein
MGFFSFFFPQLARKLQELQLEINPNYCKKMPLTHAESLATVQSVITTIKAYKEKIRLQHEDLAPLVAENEDLKAKVAALLEEDAALDTALLALSGEVIPEPETPVESEVPTEPVTE